MNVEERPVFFYNMVVYNRLPRWQAFHQLEDPACAKQPLSLPLRFLGLETTPILARRPPSTTTRQQGPLPQVLVDHLLDASQIMFRFAHIVDSSPTLPLRRTLRDLHALHQRAVDLDAHLDGDLGQVVAEEDRGVRAGALDREDHARKRLAGLESRVQDVADLGAVRIRLGEEP